MKKKDYIQLSITIILLVTGIIVGGFAGGFVAGASACILLFVTVGKIVYMKAQRRVDASLRQVRETLEKKNNEL